MKLKEWIKKHSGEILVGVVVSIITAVVMKGAEWIKEIVPTAGNSAWKFFLNAFFSAAAKATETSLITFMFSAFVGIAIVYIFNLLSKALGATKEAIATAEDIVKDINTSHGKVDKKGNKITTTEIETEAKNIIQDAKKGRKIAVAGIAFFVFYFCYILVFDFLPHKVWNYYQRDLLKIAPYIEQQELDEIKSDWVCMQSKEDYDRIYERINEIKTEYDLP